jgi:hypothetical protein
MTLELLKSLGSSGIRLMFQANILTLGVSLVEGFLALGKKSSVRLLNAKEALVIVIARI